MSERGLQRARVAEVLSTSTSSGRRDYGSGYRISTHLVLTAAHLFPAEASDLGVRLPGGEFLPARLVWRGDNGLDVALLRLDPSPSGQIAPVAFGQLPDRVERPAFDAVGYPHFATRNGNVRDARQVSGTIQLLSNAKSGLLDLSLATAAPLDAQAEGDPWSGFSGAAVFTGDGFLVGVISRRLRRAGTSSVDASTIALAFDRPGFREALAEDGLLSGPVPVSVPSSGPRMAPVLSHGEALAGLVGMRRNLADERLPFVNPGRDHVSNPANLLQSLQSRANDRGVLLVGPAGSGKSRTCFEVAKLAELAGWRALHVMPGEPLATNEHLAEAIFSSSTPAVVVIDYLNECRGIDLPELRQRLLPEAKSRGIPVGVLASARPGWLLKAAGDHVRRLFDNVELRVDGEHTTAVRSNIFAVEAPTALAELGQDRLAAACGSRPIVAMLIAREIERRVLDDTFSGDLLRLRTGDLLGWLEKRLEEDDLAIPRPQSALDVSEAGPLVKASAALTAACPQKRPAVEAAAASVLERNGLDRWRAGQLVDVLLKMGWLEVEGTTLVVVHDLVTDQLLEQTLLQAPSARINPAVAEDVLTPCLHDARTVGRFAVSFGRLLRDLDLDGRADDLGAFCDDWMRRHDRDVGQVLRNDPDPGGYALGSVLDGPPWAATAIDRWSSLMGPWLSEHAGTSHARHVFYKGLRIVAPEEANRLIDGALEWLQSHRYLSDASFVAGALLRRTDLGDRAGTVVAESVQWVERHRFASGGGFVIKALLDRNDLGDRVDTVVTHAVQWVRQPGNVANTGFVLGPLLKRPDLGDQAGAVVAEAVRWVERSADDADAGFVLVPLLERPDLGDQAATVVAEAVRWVERHSLTSGGPFVIRALLDRTDLGDLGETVFAHAVLWVRQPSNVSHAGIVLGPLLERPDLGDQAATVVAEAVQWVERHGPTSGGARAIRALLGRPDLGDRAATVVVHAVLWVQQSGNVSNAGFVLGPLLERKDLGDQADAVVAEAVRWVEQPGNDADACFVLGPLLERADLGDRAEAIVAEAVRWVQQHGDVSDADFVIRALLERADLGDRAGIVVREAVRWVRQHEHVSDVDFVIRALLERADLSDQAGAVVAHAVQWVMEHIRNPGVSFVLHRLFERSDFVEVPADLLQAIDGWADLDADDGIVYVSKLLLKRNLISRNICAAILRWVGRHPSDPDSLWRLTTLIRLVGDRPEYAAFWGEIFDRAELVMDHAIESGDPTSSSQLDLMVMNLAGNFRLGYWGSRADDLILRWCFIGMSMSRARGVREDSNFVSRVVSLVEAKRVPAREIPQLLARLRAWVARWDQGRQRGREQRPESLSIIQRAERRYGDAAAS